MKAQIEKIAAIQQLIDSCDWYLHWYEANTKGFLQLYYAQKIAKYTDMKGWLQNRLYTNIITLYNMTPKEQARYKFILNKGNEVTVNLESSAKRLARQYPDSTVQLINALTNKVIDECIASDVWNIEYVEPTKTK